MNKKRQINERLAKISVFFILTLFLTSVCLQVRGEGRDGTIVENQSKKEEPPTVTLSLRDATLKTILYKIQQQTKLNFVYKDDLIKSFGTRTIKVTKTFVTKVLDDLFANTDFTYTISGKTVSIAKRAKSDNKAAQQSVILTGRVVDAYKKPIAGALLLVKGSTRGIVTDQNGEFSFKANLDAQYEVSYLGMKPLTLTVNNSGKELTLVLHEDTQNIDEVVITGVFNKPKESFTGAVTFITKKELAEFKQRDLLRTIANIDPSFNIVENNKEGSNPNVLPEINLRGMTNIPPPIPVNTPGDINDLQTEQRAQLNTPLFILDGFEISLERMMDLNENEIENITILKDAGSTAIYGSRGSNGVIVITSVKPQAGNLRVNFNAGINIEIPDLSSYNLLNSREKLELERMAGLFDGKGVLTKQDELDKEYNSKLRAVLSGIDTYWLSFPLKTGITGNYRLSLGGGDRSFRYSLSASYGSDKGAMKGSDRSNFNGSLNISYLYKTLSFTNSVSVGMNSSNNSMYGNFSTYTTLNPYWTPYDKNGKMVMKFDTGIGLEPGDVGYVVDSKNPLYDATTTAYNRAEYMNLRNSTMLEWNVTKSFKVGAQIGFSRTTNENHDFKPASHSDFELENDPSKRGTYDYLTGKSYTYDIKTTINYGEVFGKHRIFLGVQANLSSSKSVRVGLKTSGFTHDRLDFITMASSYVGNSPNGSESENRSVGLTSSLSYNFGGAAFFDASYRVDGASSFGSYSRFRPFYTFGAGYNLNSIPFIKEKLPQISTLRLKYNYGITGSLPFQVYEALTTYQYYTTERHEGSIGAHLMSYGNPNLTWQYTYSHNMGLDATLLKGIVSVNVNYYDKLTKGTITTAKLPLSHGHDTYRENQGDIRNYGYDFSVSLRVINDPKRQISWSVRASFARNNNVLKKLSPAMKAYNETLMGRITSKDQAPILMYKEGESMDALYVVQSLGIDPSSGRELFLRRDGSVTFQYTPRDKVAIGLNKPKIQGSLSTSIRYGRLNLSLSFQLKMGGQTFNSTLLSKVENASITTNVDRRVFDGRWRTVNHYSQFRGLTQNGSPGQSSRFMQNETTLECRSLNLSYTLNSKWIKKNIGVEAINISANTNDLFRLSTIKKERGTSFPFSRRLSTSISLTF